MPTIIDQKRQLTPECERYCFHGTDLATPDGLRLLDELADWTPTIFLMEGFLGYLPTQAATSLVRLLRRKCGVVLCDVPMHGSTIGSAAEHLRQVPLEMFEGLRSRSETLRASAHHEPAGQLLEVEL